MEVGFQIILFSDEEVLKNINRVIKAIDSKVEEIESSLPKPVKKRLRQKRATPSPPPAGDNFA